MKPLRFLCSTFFVSGFLVTTALLSEKYPDDETAIREISKQLKKEPNDPSLLFQFAWFMQKRGFDKLAEKYYKKCLSVHPKYSPAMVNLGNLYARRGEMPLAEKYFLSALENTPNAPEAHYNLGAFYLKKKNYSKAILRFEKVVFLDPQNKEAYLNLARIHLHFHSKKREVEQLEIAKDYLITAAKISPKYAHVYFNLGRVYEIKEQEGTALEYYRRASVLYPSGSKYRRLSIQKINQLKQ